MSASPRRWFRHRIRTPSPVGWLIGSQLIMFTGIAAMFPVVPLYVAHRGGSSVDIALFIAGPMAANMLVQLPAGYLVDRVGRRPVLVGARVGYGLVSLLLFLDVGPLWLLGALRATQGAFGGAYSPALRAAIADLTPAERRAERYAQLQATDMVGLLVGPAIGGTVALWRDSGVFLCSAVAIALGMLPMLRVPETHHVAERGRVPAAPAGWWRDRALLSSAGALAATGLVFTMYDVVWPQYLTVRGMSTLGIGLSISLFALPILLLTTPGGRLADRGDRRVILAACTVTAGTCAAVYPALRSIPVILTVGVVEAVAYVMVEPTLFAVVGDAAPAQARGRAMGLGGFSQFGGSALGAAVLGSLYGVREGIPFWAGAATLIAAGLVCALMVPARRPPSALAAGDAEAGGVPLDALQDGDDARRPDVDRPLLSRELDEVVAARGDADR